jgi:hypothetical protein
LKGKRCAGGGFPRSPAFLRISTSGVEKDACPGHRGGQKPEPLPLSNRLTTLFHLASGNQVELRHDLWAGQAVFGEIPVALKVPDRSLSLPTEDPIHLSGVEANRVETRLKFGHVLTPDHRSAKKKETVAETISGFVERSPGIGTNDSVDTQTLGFLELGNRGGSALFETSSRIVGDCEPESAQTILDITDGKT